VVLKLRRLILVRLVKMSGEEVDEECANILVGKSQSIFLSSEEQREDK
jgi:hypothetical protein